MGTMGDDRTADAVFRLLSDETRVDVLRAIAVAQHERQGFGAGPAGLSFSDVYDRVDVDSTSKLSYHLGELTGTFLRKGEHGYSFTHAGDRIARLVLSENYDQPPDFDPRETGGTCLFCGETPLEASLDQQYFTVRCPSCERAVSGYPVAPAQVRSHEGDDLLRSVEGTLAADYRLIRRGTCPKCAGRLSTDVRELEEGPLPDADPFVVVDSCEACLRRYSGPMTYGVAYHPASVAFHWDRGVDVTTKGMWEFHDHLRAGRWTAERLSTDPAEYEVVLRRGDDALRVRLDADATVTRTERVRATNVADRRT